MDNETTTKDLIVDSNHIFSSILGVLVNPAEEDIPMIEDSVVFSTGEAGSSDIVVTFTPEGWDTFMSTTDEVRAEVSGKIFHLYS